ncbi:MAG TPA: hypothetical protein PLW80_08785 [Spirochaetales bacterium]|nr:hypothetical protein [Spirochaetales bacterium]HPB66646.1 hypothetical protein [Spirochaetales bacterium]HPG85537.1 hypothetical protein [Spirochaetales bacterium]HPM72298.1 hypothetical protein [Spirochaetales bacterium]HQO65808.1 hypothetical protein [Spirochaetales bacterium]
MDERLREVFPDGGLIKTVDEPNGELSAEQKAHLNRRGNMLYNGGDLETARRIFQTTGYSDGLIRVGESYMDAGRPVDALKMFKLAHDQARSAELIERAAMAIRKMLDEKDTE